MRLPPQILCSKNIVFAIGLVLFIISASVGLEKIHYGFNFMDEGYHMTESWRLAAGDHFLKDKHTGVMRLYTLINRIIFEINPDMSLLGFRKLQFFLALFSLLFFGSALYRITKEYWYLPLVFTLFAVTGLDPIGMFSNLNYYTYPHLFLVLSLSCLLFALKQESAIIKHGFYILSGFFIWCISLSVLHMSILIAYPALIFAFSRYFKFKTISLDVKGLSYILAPFFICWVLFMAVYNYDFVDNLLNSARLFLSSTSHASQALMQINYEVIKHILIVLLVLSICFIVLKKFLLQVSIPLLVIASIVMYVIIDTSFFHLIDPYFRGWFSCPMWAVSALVSFGVIFWIHIAITAFNRREYTAGEELAVLLMIPSTVFAVFTSYFSTLGVLTILHTAIPVVAAFAVSLMSMDKLRQCSYGTKFIIISLLLFPFYYKDAWHDWEFTYFDVSPKEATVTISQGFGKNIITNPLYDGLYQWIISTTEAYTDKDDFIISYVISPMVHMVAKRRPSLDDSYVTLLDAPPSYYQVAIKRMSDARREPKMVFLFDGVPAFFKNSPEENSYEWFSKQPFPDNDPISEYVKKNMLPVDSYQFTDNFVVKCFINKTAFDDEKILSALMERNPKNYVFHYISGNMNLKQGNLEKALDNYSRSLELNPNYINALQKTAIVYSLKGNNRKALEFLNKIIRINPGQADAFYNIACIYGKENNIEKSVDWLRKALQKGFNDWSLIQKDNDLRRTRNSSEYKILMREYGGG